VNGYYHSAGLVTAMGSGCGPVRSLIVVAGGWLIQTLGIVFSAESSRPSDGLYAHVCPGHPSTPGRVCWCTI
jgi:hypothetical protein